jgi:hypothetical protein
VLAIFDADRKTDSRVTSIAFCNRNLVDIRVLVCNNGRESGKHAWPICRFKVNINSKLTFDFICPRHRDPIIAALATALGIRALGPVNYDAPSSGE